MNLTTTSPNARLKLAQNRSCPAIRIFTASGNKGARIIKVADMLDIIQAKGWRSPRP